MEPPRRGDVHHRCITRAANALGFEAQSTGVEEPNRLVEPKRGRCPPARQAQKGDCLQAHAAAATGSRSSAAAGSSPVTSMPSIYRESATTKSGTSEPLTLAGRGSPLGAAAGAAVGGVLLVVVVEGGELGEGRRELVTVDLFGVDRDRLEQGLAEEPPLGAGGLEVGGLDVVGELERVVERLEERLVLDLVSLEAVVGG
jgi:hypothetical protein